MVPQDDGDHAEEHFQPGEVLVVVEVQAEFYEEVLEHVVALAQGDPGAGEEHEWGGDFVEALLVLDVVCTDEMVQEAFKAFLLLLGEVGGTCAMAVESDDFVEGVVGGGLGEDLVVGGWGVGELGGFVGLGKVFLVLAFLYCG